MSSAFTPISFHNSSTDLAKTLDADLYAEDIKFAIICDTNTLASCLPKIAESKVVQQAELIEIEPGEASKSIEIAVQIWETLQEHQFQKSDVLLSLGGGVVCDLGGFVAATFKRGMRFRHIPTSYLAMVDASVGGKQGINLGGAKNQIGVIQPQEKTYICNQFLATLPQRDLVSGFAETIKHGLIAQPKLWYAATEKLDELMTTEWIKQSVEVKQAIVNIDPFEKGERKKLNFGHTIGHAIEAAHEGELLHGEAVAWGMVLEVFISHEKLGFPQQDFEILHQLIIENFSKPSIEIAKIEEYINHDKKNNQEGLINFTLLEKVGEAIIDQQLTKKEVTKYLKLYLAKNG